MLAGLLLANAEAGGAAVRGVVPYGVATFELAGELDWAHHVGRVTVTTSGVDPPVPPRDVVWNPDVVFEQVPGIEDRLAAQGRPGIQWVARPLSPKDSSLHLVLRLLDATSSTQRDNPELLLGRDIRWLRRDRVGSTAVDVFREDRTTSWVGRRDGVLVRLDAALATTGATASFTFSDRRPRTIETPPDPAIVALSEVAPLYQELLGAAGR